MNNNINPDFNETSEQREFRHNYMRNVHAAYRFHESLGIMDLGEDKKISLQDIYVPLRFSGKELDESRDWEIQDDTFNLFDIIDKSNNIVLSGKPGSGKTTISRMIISLLSSKELTGLSEKLGRRIPLYFKLRDYPVSKLKTPLDLLNNFIDSQSKTINMNISFEHLEFYLKMGWCFLIFDGVDEVGGLKNRLKIRKFILSHFENYNDKNVILVTSRPSGLENAPFSRFINDAEAKIKNIHLLNLFYVDSFNKTQAQDFSLKWFALRDENPDTQKSKANEFIYSIEKIQGLSTLKRRPVFLTMMAHIHTTKGKLPYSRAQAYEYMVQAYIENLDITRRLHKTMYEDEEFLDWSFEDKIRLLQGIAYKFHVSELGDEKDTLIVVSRQDLLKTISNLIDENRESWQTIKPEHKEALLKFYLTRTGLLHEPEENKIQFSHLSFQEFLAARYIFKKVIEENLFQVPKIIENEITQRLNEKMWNRWSETILLFFNLNKAAAHDILKSIEDTIKQSKNAQERNTYFHYLILKMLDSDEYGIKDSDMSYWVEKMVTFICTLDVGKDKSLKEQSESKNFILIQEYFSSMERHSKFDSAKKSTK